MRVLRPYAHFEVRAHLHHLRSTAQVLACLRAIDDHLAPSDGASPNGKAEAGPAGQDGCEASPRTDEASIL
jgi:hypothetical protein